MTSPDLTNRAPEARRAVTFIFITLLIDTIGFGLIMPVLPALIMQLTGERLDAAARYGGWLGFVFAAVQFFCAPLLGNLSDRYGRRPVLLFSLLALGLDYVVMGLAPRIEWLFLGRFIAGVAGASFGPAYAYLADISPPERRAQNFGIAGAAFGVGFIAGPAIGGLLGSFGPRVPFFVAATFSLLNVTFGYFALPESLAPESRRAFDWSRAHPMGTLRQMRKYPAVITIATAAFLWQLGHQVLPSVWAFYMMEKFQWTTAAVGASLAAAGIVMAVSQGFLTRTLIPKLGGERRSALVGLVAGACVYAWYALAPVGWMIYLGIAGWAFAGLAWPSLNAMMSQRIPPSAQGELQGGLASVSSLASIIGPPALTQMFAHFAGPAATPRFPGAPFIASAALAIMSALVLARGTASAEIGAALPR